MFDGRKKGFPGLGDRLRGIRGNGRASDNFKRPDDIIAARPSLRQNPLLARPLPALRIGGMAGVGEEGVMPARRTLISSFGAGGRPGDDMR